MLWPYFYFPVGLFNRFKFISVNIGGPSNTTTCYNTQSPNCPADNPNVCNPFTSLYSIIRISQTQTPLVPCFILPRLESISFLYSRLILSFFSNIADYPISYIGNRLWGIIYPRTCSSHRLQPLHLTLYIYQTNNFSHLFRLNALNPLPKWPCIKLGHINVESIGVDFGGAARARTGTCPSQ